MPADRADADDNVSGDGDFYGQFLDEELRKALAHAPGTLDLKNEIKLIRTLAGWLGANMPANHAHVIRTLGVLLRAVGIQARASGGSSELEAELRAAAERILGGLETVEAGDERQ